MRPIAAYLALLTLAAGVGEARADALTGVCPTAGQPCAVPCVDDVPIWSLQLLAGYYPMTSLGPKAGFLDEAAEVDYCPLAFRLGRKSLHSRHLGTWYEGKYEFLFEYSVSPITRTFGTYFTGPSLLGRYNFEHEGSWVVPYVQAGVGLVLTDAHQDMRQRLIGQAVEFYLQAGVGLRFLITDSCSLDVESGFQHISNARLADRNGGINNVGVSVGITHTFGR